MNFSNIILLVVLNIYCIESLNARDYARMSGMSGNMDSTLRMADVPVKYCGKNIIRAITLECQNRAHLLHRETRTFPKTNIFNYDLDYMNGVSDSFDDDSSYPFIGKSYGLSLLPNKERRRAGIVEECCEKGCTRSELGQYCSD
ncbi:unnamed protein product [Phyllotreta striolata]|uniref:Insulin-like domain-containing protein n=1 Tax=Phyllotreta striolata TaxID=444603 RepID=A0A9N9TJY7_PHYSR|nr:unnamed protein product [Phyllotreta striolata]